MNFIEKTQGEGESIFKIFKLNKYSFIPSILIMTTGVLIVGAAWVLLITQGEGVSIITSSIGAIIFLVGFVKYLQLKSIDMGVTSHRVVFKEGIFSIHNEEIQLNAIETIEVAQGIIGRIFGFGTVKVTGRGDSVVMFEGIDDPVVVKKIIGSAVGKFTSN